ncbi:MAG: hypothetical protein J6T08_01585 [Lentisphaeria bacterium]|nr:hypothetical protein [Lentisphaeria bacterium]
MVTRTTTSSSFTRTYTLEIWGDNNSFTIEAETCCDPYENPVTGRIEYSDVLTKATLIHGDRRRDITRILTNDHIKQIHDGIDDILRAEIAEAEIDAYLDREENNARQIICDNERWW